MAARIVDWASILAELLKFAGVLSAVFALWPEPAQERFEQGLIRMVRRSWWLFSRGFLALAATALLGAPLLILLPVLMLLSSVLDAAFRSRFWMQMAGEEPAARGLAVLAYLAVAAVSLWVSVTVLALIGVQPGPFIGPSAFRPLAWAEAGWSWALGLPGCQDSCLAQPYLALRDGLYGWLQNAPLGLGAVLGLALASSDILATILGLAMAASLVILPLLAAMLIVDVPVLGFLHLSDRVKARLGSPVRRLILGATMLFALGEFALLLISLGRFAGVLPRAS